MKTRRAGRRSNEWAALVQNLTREVAEAGTVSPAGRPAEARGSLLGEVPANTSDVEG